MLHREKLRWVPADIDWDIVAKKSTGQVDPCANPFDLVLPPTGGSDNQNADPSPPCSPLLDTGNQSSGEEQVGVERTNEVEWNWRDTNQQSDESNSERANQASDEGSDAPEAYHSCEDRTIQTPSDVESDNGLGEDAKRCSDVTSSTDDNSGTAVSPHSGPAAASDSGPDHSTEPTTLQRRYPTRKRKQPPYLGWYHNPYITKHGRIGVLDFWPYFMATSWPPTKCRGYGRFQMD